MASKAKGLRNEPFIATKRVLENPIFQCNGIV